VENYPNSICFLSIKCACHTVLSFLVDFLDSHSNMGRTIVHKRVERGKNRDFMVQSEYGTKKFWQVFRWV
jgi:hypothetical protein